MDVDMCTAAGEWEACGDRFYERHELYTMSWSDVRLDQMRQVLAADLAALHDSPNDLTLLSLQSLPCFLPPVPCMT